MPGSHSRLLALATPMVVLLLAFIAPARACSIPPDELTVHHAQLVQRTSRIALGTFDGGVSERGPDGGLRYEAHFAMIEVVKGDVPPTFALSFESFDRDGFRDEPEADFRGHEDWGVWDHLFTRQGNGPDCEMHPRFELGASYLIFLDRPYHWRSFERVDRPDDRWLAAVKALVATPAAPSGMALSLADYLRDQKAVFIGEVLRCGVQDPELRFATELKVRKLLWGKLDGPVLMRRVSPRCKPGLLVLVAVHRFSSWGSKDERKPPGRLLTLVDREETPAQRLRDDLRVNFHRGDSEAVITDDPFPTLARIKQVAKSLARRP